MSGAKNACMIILAAGTGERFGQRNKALLEIHGIAAINLLLAKVAKINFIKRIVIVANEACLSDIRNLCEVNNNKLEIVTGGETRFISLLKALEFLDPAIDEHDYIFVHDAARPLVTVDLLNALGAACRNDIIVAPLLQVNDNLRVKLENGYSQVSGSLFLTQTPQCFNTAWIKPYFQNKEISQMTFRDEVSVAEHFGLKAEFISGDSTNIKLTYPTDLMLAEAIYSLQKSKANG